MFDIDIMLEDMGIDVADMWYSSIDEMLEDFNSGGMDI